MNTAAPCALCDPNLGPVLHVSAHWRLVLNRNQDLLGKCFLALRRHEESVADLAGGEWTELHQQLGLAMDALRRAFQPDHVNCVFLQNQDRHVHLHVVPRYAGERRLAGYPSTIPATRGTTGWTVPRGCWSRRLGMSSFGGSGRRSRHGGRASRIDAAAPVGVMYVQYCRR